MGVKTRLVEHIGTTVHLRTYWGKDCPNCLGKGGSGFHNGQLFIARNNIPWDTSIGGRVEDVPASEWPTRCDHCKRKAPTDAVHQLFRSKRYNTPTGDLTPGDMFWIDHTYQGRVKQCWAHDNCNGMHLHVILPTGHNWDIDGQASNCTMPKDKLHRCWIRDGEPPNITVSKGKNANTCKAGAGSIGVPGYHGFLRNGELT